MSIRGLSLRYVCSLIVLSALVAARAVAAGDLEAGVRPETVLRFQVRVIDPPLGDAVQRAVEGAYDRLDQPRCQRLFEEFSDATGTPLSLTLRARGVTARAHLARVLFYDGEPHGACEVGRIAGTTPGSSVIFVCPVFEILSDDTAQAIVIHELLHTLGLGENPPSSLAITRRVMQGCGDPV